MYYLTNVILGFKILLTFGNGWEKANISLCDGLQRVEDNPLQKSDDTRVVDAAVCQSEKKVVFFICSCI